MKAYAIDFELKVPLAFELKVPLAFSPSFVQEPAWIQAIPITVATTGTATTSTQLRGTRKGMISKIAANAGTVATWNIKVVRVRTLPIVVGFPARLKSGPLKESATTAIAMSATSAAAIFAAPPRRK